MFFVMCKFYYRVYIQSSLQCVGGGTIMLAIKRRFEYHSIYMYAAVAVVTFFGTLVVLYLATTATINSSRADLVKIASDTPVIESTDANKEEKKDKQSASANTTSTQPAVQTPAAIADTSSKPKTSTTKPVASAPTTTTDPAPVIIVTPPQTPVVTNPTTDTSSGSDNPSLLTPVVNLLDAVL